MRSRSIVIPVFIAITFILAGLVSGPGCANIIPPAGGPRDSIPPQLEKVEPGDSTLLFKEKRIVFTFDEFIDGQNLQQDLMISPNPKNSPVIEWKLNTVTIRLRDSLDANTTYTIDFANSIKDINESNVAENLVYTFSTGSYFDSLELRGKVLLAETGKIDTTLIVMLHSNPSDSAVVTEKPRYVTKLDGKGNFVFRNLPPKTYSVYALKDEGGSRRYSNERQLFGFVQQPVTIKRGMDSLVIHTFIGEAPRPTTTTTPATTGRRGNTAADRRLKFTTNLVGEQQDLLTKFIMNFEEPLKIFDSTKVGFFTDTTFTPVDNWRLEPDSTRRQLQLQHAWKENTQYHLILNIDFAEDSSGKKLLKTDTLSFKTKKTSEYGQLKIRFRNLDLNLNPVLQFVLNGSLVQSHPLSTPDYSNDLFVPGDYELRIHYDENKNGKWDTGEFFGKRKQPELVKPVERRITVRPNWGNDFDIAL